MMRVSSRWILEAMTNEFNKKNVDNTHRKIAYAYLYGICQRCNHKAVDCLSGGRCDLRDEKFHQRLCKRDQAVLYLDNK